MDIEDVKRLDIRPGEQLLVTLPHAVEPERLSEIADRFKAAFPGVRCLFVTNDIDITVISPEAQ